eukprot:270095_1
MKHYSSWISKGLLFELLLFTIYQLALVHYDMFKHNKNKFTEVIKLNHDELLRKYVNTLNNNNMIKGMSDQWLYPTIDINTIKKWNLNNKYIDYNNMPNDRNEWHRVVHNKYNNIYKDELDTFVAKNGRIFASMIGPDIVYDKYKNRTYSGMIDELKYLYNDNISSLDIKGSIKVLLNWTKANWYTANKNDSNNNPFDIQDE